MRRLNYGEVINMNDIIKFDNRFFKGQYTVTRVTKTFCFSKKEYDHETKFPRNYDFGFQPYPKQKWNTVAYEVFRPNE
jgi:hypothetical protein